jgi:malonyl-CoA decarboxylase
MTPVSLTFSDLSNTKLAPLDRAKQLAATLLSERSEASGALVARQLHEVLRALDASDRHGFQRYLATEFQPDRAALRAAAERYLADGTAEAAAALARAADPPRQELLRRINMAPGGTGALIAMRSEIASCLRGEPELKLLDADLKHLFASWFNRGFIELRRIDWQTPAAVLEKLIAYEAVHEIKGWDDLRRRLAPDRRCFAFFHPALPGEPLIFVEVALVEGLATAVPPLGSSRRAGAGRLRRHRDLLFDLQLSGRPARRGVRQFPDQAGGRGAQGGVSAAEAFFYPVAGTGVSALAQSTACEWKRSRCRAVATTR